MLTFPQYLGNTLYKHANMLETRYRDMQIFRKHVIETWKLYNYYDQPPRSLLLYFRQSMFETIN